MKEVVCKYCGKKFEIENKYYNRSKTKNFFCCKKCCHEANSLKNNLVLKFDDKDFVNLINSCKSLREVCFKLGYKDASGYTIDSIKKRCDKLGISYPIDKKVKGNRIIKERTKGEILSSIRTYQGYRSAIRKDAEKTFEELDGSYSCCVCGYDKHIEIAHVKAVSDFSHNTLVKEINDIENIIPLCPNHHWEFDNGVISEDDLLTIKEYIKNRKNSGMEE